MRNRSKQLDQTHLDRLAEFEDSLIGRSGDKNMLPELRTSIRALLSEGGVNAAEIRAILQRRFESGDFRRETHTLALNILDRVVAEEIGLSPGIDGNDDGYSETTILPPDQFQPLDEENRLQVGTVLRDRFLLQEELAGGSMGVVYKALDRRLAEVGSDSPYVAIKVLAPKLSRNGNALRALQQEAAKGRCLAHPNIVRFIDLDREDDLYFVVMEWLDGRSLAEILDSSPSGGLDCESALDIVRQVGRALAYAHRCGVVHADVKPGNIIITQSGEVKLFDFGVARVRQKGQIGKPAFDPGVLNARTAAYSSMQVISGEDPVPADDIFSLGCLMYRLVAGYRVFGPRNAAEAAEAGMNPQRPQGLSDAHWAALRKALSYSRVSRFTSLDEFLEALDHTPGELRAKIDVPPRDIGVEASRWSWKTMLLLIVVLAAIALVSQDRLLRQLGLPIPGVGSAVGPAAVAEPADESPQPGQPDRNADLPATAADTITPSPLEQRVPAGTDQDAAPQTFEQNQPGDASAAPPAALTMALAAPGSAAGEFSLTLREDEGGAAVDLVRSHDVDTPLTVQFLPVDTTGTLPAIESAQFRLADNGVVRFAAGQDRARTEISMISDALRESDQVVTLTVGKAGIGAPVYAVLNLSLEDDDQRKFEARLLPNTVSFARGQVSVAEKEAAVQIDVLRYNADDSPLDVGYIVRDITATEGEDYFAKARNTVSFQPGQRTARIIVPIVQDARAETDEAFVLELLVDNPSRDRDIFLRVAVLIRDDDS